MQPDDRYYLQDSRGYVGNDMLFWAKEGNGYTTDLSKAHIYTKDQAVAQHNMRHSDIPWPATYIEARTRPAVDMQQVKREEALSGTGIQLHKVERHGRRQQAERLRCVGCGRLMSEAGFWSGECGHCGEDSRP